MPLSQVDVVWGDTDRCPYSVGESGSRTTIMTGYAVDRGGARSASSRSPRRGCRPATQVLIASATPEPAARRARCATRSARTSSRSKSTPSSVDVRVTQVHRGARLRPDHQPADAPTSQIQGAAIQGIGMALHEDLLYDRRTGQPLTAGYYGARIPTHRDAPDDRGHLHRDRRRLRAVRREEHRRGGHHPGAGRGRQRDLQRDRPPHEGSADHARQDSGGARMKTFTNANARDVAARGRRWSQDARRAGHAPSFAGGGSDLLGAGEGSARHAGCRRQPARRSRALDQVSSRSARGLTIGGLITLDALSRHRGDPARLRGAGRSGRQRRDAADPQRRHAGRQRLPAAVVLVLPQRLSRASRPAATSASRSPARTSSTPSSAAARATSSIRRTRRRRWWRSTRRSASPARRRAHAARPPDFFALPRQNAAPRERARPTTRCWSSVQLPRAAARHAQHLSQGARSRGVDARRRQRGGRAGDGRRRSCRSARVVLGGVAPIPWRLPEVEKLLAGQRITAGAGRSRPARRRSPAPGRCRRTPTRCR